MTERDSVLVVDDDDGILTLLQSELGEHYDVTVASSAEQGLAQLQAREFSAIVSDVRLPGVDGLSLIGQCAVRYPQMVRVILTGYDDETIGDAAVGPHGAYKVLKPWGRDLLIILGNALEQRRANIALRRHLDLNSKILEIDRRLHPQLDIEGLVTGTANEMVQLPEVTAAAVYWMLPERKGETESILIDKDGVVPPLKGELSTPLPYKGGFLLSVPIGDRHSPIAIVALRLADVGSDTMHFLDFIRRQAMRVMLLMPSGFAAEADGGKSADPVGVSVTWLIDELTTPTTVLSSAPYSMTKILEAVKGITGEGEEFAAAVEEMEELFGDITKVAHGLVALLNRLRSGTAAVDGVIQPRGDSK